jgi:spore coat polysaccharide biosynthesis protein SpsF
MLPTMTTAVIIQARMGSTRLPGKVLKPLAGKPMLAQVIRRARAIPGTGVVAVATSDLAEDDAIAACCRGLDTPCLRGSALDVLARYHGAAAALGASTIVRITSDCPLLSPEISGRVLAAAGPGDHYTSNCRRRTFPRGLDTEVVPWAALDLAHREATAPADREHVMPFLWRQPERFRLRDVVDGVDRSALRWTVDTPEDYALAERFYDLLGEDFTYADALAAWDAHPEWAALNAHIEQKKV